MENGSNSPCLEDELLDHAENGVVSPIMVKTLEEENDNTDKNSPNEVTSHFENTKANGDNITDIDNTENDSYTSESDALVIDESVPKKSKKLKNTQQQSLVRVNEDHLFDNNEFVTHSNPFFNESLFELSQLHQVPDAEEILNGSNILEGPSDNNCVKQKDKKLKGKPKPKLREYTQYLGLQPTVQFKCSKCGRAGFESLSTLQDHVNQCNEKSVQETSGDDSCSGFKLTRKVFLCSACGTYYENWNLYVHMLEIHKRFICLYCLGMFSILEDLCQHLQSRHNLQPGHKNTLDEFFNVYKEPCYIICCECNKLFSEQDNFFDHNCVGKVKNKKLTKQHITPENHVTGESESVLDNPGEVIENHSSQVSCNNSLNNHIGDNKTLTMETNKNMTEVANEEHERGCQDHVNDKNHVANDACENNLGENHLESSFEQDENTDIKEAEPECTREAENSSKSDMEDFLENGEVEDKEEESEEVPVETRKVPKLSLKIPKFETYPEPDADESDDSEKLTMEVDQIESENDDPENMNECKAVNDISNTDQEKETPDAEKPVEEQQETKNDPQYHIAGSEIPVIELELEQPLDKFEPCVLLQKCLKMTVASCIYCNHARKIAVNGRQLGLHCIAEHRFSAVVNSITAEELIPMSFVNKIKDSLEELERTFFNLETNFSGEAVTFSHLFECLQCYFSTNVHKELYLHNRKFHSKNLLLCIVCKSNFYSYSELICHLCPGQYIIDYDMKFRCCMCVNDDLPSSFRLMVHLRKRHNTCDVCLEMCNTQTRLSNHVWRHKLHHFCYRCGIAYRNKMDIMGHLFWKHGTESVQCKKCLQKKWPHVYHFCVPPASFSCDECLMTFSRAVNLKVHKRIHAEEKKWSCTFEGCEEGFISKKLMEKHEKRHYDPPEEAVVEENAQRDSDNVRGDEESTRAAESDKPEDKPKQMIDVLDLPALNLSESDSSDSEPEKEPVKPAEEDLQSNQIVADTELDPPGDLPPLDILQEDESSSAVIQNIWDNFKNYQESKNKLDIMFAGGDKVEEKVDEIPVPVVEEELTAEVALRDHDYFVEPEKDAMIVEVKPALNESIDHDYCSAKSEGSVAEKPPLDPPPPSSSSPQSNAKPFTVASATKKDSSSSSSSDTDSSSCSCGSSCSCKSSSGSSSSSSDSSNSDSSTEEGRKKQMARRLKRRERAKKMKMDVEEDKKVVDVVTTDPPSLPIDTPIRESDLETTESETDEEFYDEAPQKFAKKILDEKRQQLLELLGPNSVPNGGFIESTSRPPTPPAGVVEEEERKKKKSKSKKRKKRKSERKDPSDRPITTPPPILPTASIISPDIPIPPYYQQFHQQLQLQQQQQPTVAPITLSLSRSSPAPVAATATPPTAGRREAVDSGLRASKRRRVPNKFYGYSSDEDKEKEKTPHVPKWKKVESGHQPNTTPQLVPPITIKTTPAPAPTPTVEPISIRTAAHLSDFRVRRPRPRPTMPPIGLGGRAFAASPTERDSGSESNDSSSDEEDKEEETQAPPKPAQPQLYCYCQCPYDEVSEMIGCDASDCAIEWFHFECVGIMVPPKGQWYCPDCRKKKARRELMQNMRNN